MPMETQSPSAVPLTHVWMWSTAAFAAEAAEEAPRASMMAAPRLATVGMNVSAIQASSSMAARACLPAIRAWDTSGYCVAEWLPQIATRWISDTGVRVLFASWLMGRLWSRRGFGGKGG